MQSVVLEKVLDNISCPCANHEGDNVLICEELDYKNIVFKCPACGTRITVTIGEQYVRDNY